MAAAQQQRLSVRLDMSTASGGWAAKAIASSSIKKRDEITESADRPSRVTLITPSSRTLGLEAVQRWQRGGNSGAVKNERSRVQARARPATAKVGEAIEGDHTGNGGGAHQRNSAGVGRSQMRSQRAGVLNDQTIGCAGRRQARKRARRPGAASTGSTEAYHHRNGEDGRSKSDRVMAMAIPAPATGNQLEQDSLMQRLKLAKRQRDSEEATRILEDALAQDDATDVVDVFVFSATVGVFAKTGEWESAIGVLGVMKEKGVKPNDFTFNQAITACGNGGAWKWAVYLLKAMPKMGVTPDVISYNATIAACAKGKQSEIAMVILQEMTEAGRVAPNALTYSTVMSAVAEKSGTLTDPTAAAAAAAANWKRVVYLLEEMRGRNITPDATGYGLAVAACAEAGQADMAVKLLRQMHLEDHVTPSLKMYNAAMTACHETGKWELAVILLGEAKATHGVSPDRVTYTEAIESCRKGGQPGLVAALSKEMQEASI